MVDADEVGGAGDAGWGAGGDDDDVAALTAADAQEFLVDLGDHLVGGVDLGAEEGFDAPGEVELGSGGRFGVKARRGMGER